ncbi:hypothetical protein BgiMline_002765, partial [Biomphalaria glabrata]
MGNGDCAGSDVLIIRVVWRVNEERTADKIQRSFFDSLFFLLFLMKEVIKG